jgi:hypothetical protein
MSLAADGSFYGLIMAAMRNADTDNRKKLQVAFPKVWDELQLRYNSPGGCLNQKETDWLMHMIAEQDADDELEESEDDYEQRT